MIDIDKKHNINFHDNLFSGSHTDTCRQTDMMKLISAFTVIQTCLKMSMKAQELPGERQCKSDKNSASLYDNHNKKSDLGIF